MFFHVLGGVLGTVAYNVWALRDSVLSPFPSDESSEYGDIVGLSLNTLSLGASLRWLSVHKPYYVVTQNFIDLFVFGGFESLVTT